MSTDVEVVVVGGGIAGLTAAWRLRHRDVLLLEASERVGGRIRSERSGPYALNWGAHVFGAAGSATGTLLDEVGVAAHDVPGRLTAMHMNGAFLASGRVETYPFRIPMDWRSRLALMRAGAKVRLGVVAYGRAARRRPGESSAERQLRLLRFRGDETFRDVIGPLPPGADDLFRPTVSRSAGEPEEISGGTGIGYFHLVWSPSDGLSRNIAGGSSVLPESIAAQLGARVRTGARVQGVEPTRDGGAIVHVAEGGALRAIRARRVVMAAPAHVTREVVAGLPGELRDALGRIVYGPYVVVAFATNETEPQPWDGVYAIATPKRPFNMVFNMASLQRGAPDAPAPRAPGGSLMAYSAAGLARPLLELDDAAIVARYVRELEQMFPGFERIVERAVVQRWPRALPYAFPGRHRLQAVLTRPAGPIALAGDFLGSSYTETAIQSGMTAARWVDDTIAM